MMYVIALSMESVLEENLCSGLGSLRNVIIKNKKGCLLNQTALFIL